MMNNDHGSLHRAKANKEDEFYTLYNDVDKELQHYKEFKLELGEFIFLMYLYNLGDKFLFDPGKFSNDLNLELMDIMNYISIFNLNIPSYSLMIILGLTFANIQILSIINVKLINFVDYKYSFYKYCRNVLFCDSRFFN